MRNLHLCGISGAGKSTFGGWLAETHGFVHIDVDRTSGNLTGYFEALEVGRDVVLDYAFPSVEIPRIRRMQQELQMESWWFEGDEQACFRSFLRAKGDSFFWRGVRQNYIAEVRENWPAIAALIGDRRIYVVQADDTRLTAEEIYSRIWSADL